MPHGRWWLMATALGVAAARGGEKPVAADSATWVRLPPALLAAAAPPRHAGGELPAAATTNVRSLQVYAGCRAALLDGVNVWLQAPPREAGRDAACEVARADFDSLLLPVLWTTAAPPARLCVVLDPGHGGDDTGTSAINPLVREKDLALDLALRAAARLEAAGLRVWLTRQDDAALTLGARTRVARQHEADVFVSIHANAAPLNPLANGVETFVLPVAGCPGTAEGSRAPPEPVPGNRFDAANARLGFALHRRCAPPSAMDRGLKRARYVVLRDACCPAALVECGFLTNAGDAARLARNESREEIAAAIADGILDFASFAPRLDRPGAETPPTIPTASALGPPAAVAQAR